MRNWNSARAARDSRLQAGARYARGKLVAAHDATALLEAVLRPGDRVCLEGDNQKQADLLAAALAAVDNRKIHDLHMVLDSRLGVSGICRSRRQTGGASP